MSTVPSRVNRPLLYTGQRLGRDEFMRLYEQTPEGFKAELIGGVVHVASPLKLRHGTNHLPLGTLFFLYESRTPGVESGDNTTILLGEKGVPQPDLFLRILPEYGGRSRTTADEYMEGAAELISEIAYSSRSIDLGAKLSDYRRYGVQEYLVLSLKEKRLYWFDLPTNQELRPDDDGVYRMRTFPGLWIHGEALIAKETPRMLACLEMGLTSPEHAQFVRRLERFHRAKTDVTKKKRGPRK